MSRAWPDRERSDGPLRGIRVLDLSRVLAGPYAAMLLGDLGADVIKIEHPEGDETRRWGPPYLGDTAVYYLAANRNKRSGRADLRNPQTLAVVRDLAAAADVVIENFRPNALAKFELDYESVLATNPKVVYCSITGFGSDSPMRDRGGYDLVAQAMGGMMSITGEAGRPTKVGVASADLATGMYAVIAILGAMVGRERGAEGSHVEVALLDSQVSFLANQAMNWLAGGLNPGAMGSAHPNLVPYQAFGTATGPIVVAVGTDEQFAALCRLVGRPELATDERFAHNAGRVEHRDVLCAALQERLETQSQSDWTDAFDRAGIPNGPIRTIREVFEDPVVAQRMVRHVDDGTGRPVPQVVSPFRLDGRNPTIDFAPPALGEHDADLGLGATSST